MSLLDQLRAEKAALEAEAAGRALRFDCGCVIDPEGPALVEQCAELREKIAGTPRWYRVMVGRSHFGEWWKRLEAGE